jgi:hypothetical protein
MNWLIELLIQKANASGTDIVRWSDLFDVLDKLKGNNAVDYTENPMAFSDLPEYADEAAATTGGLSGGEFYRDEDGIVRQKLQDL